MTEEEKAELNALQETIQHLRETIAMGNEAISLQAGSFKLTIDRQRRDIEHLENRDHGTSKRLST